MVLQAYLRKVTVLSIVAIWLCPGASPAQAAQAPARPAPVATAPVAPSTTTQAPAQSSVPTPATTAEIERYRQREQQARGLEHFRGGARIGSTTLIVILLLVIIIVLLL